MLHLIKLSVGPQTLSDLANWQAQRIAEQKRARKMPELMHITRHMPKRAQELLEGGSIYWVIKGFVCARQPLLALRPLLCDGVPHCGLVYGTELIRVAPRPRRAFQGWRYLEPQDAPPDLARGSNADNMPDDMRRELAELGLL